MRKFKTMFGFNKKNMALLLHVNAKTVGRYENGKITQSHQIDRLYRIFQNFPLAVRMFLDDTSRIMPLPIDPEFSPISSNQASMSAKEKMPTIIEERFSQPQAFN